MRGGLSGASLQAIAEQAGVAVGTIYNYFDDKDRLFEALFTRRREELFVAMDDAAKLHAKDSFEVQLDAFLRSVFAYFDGRRAFLRLALEFDPSAPQPQKGKGSKSTSLQQLQERAERVVEIGVRQKKLRDDDADLVAAILVSIVRGVLVLRAADDRPFLAETERAATMFLRGAGR